MSRTASGRLGVDAPPWRLGSPPPQRSSLGPELFCLGSSSLNRPHPPHSRAHRDFVARRLIRNAFAMRERLSDPRVVPDFRWLFRLDMPSSMTPGSSIIVAVQFSDVDIGLRQDLSGSALPKFPQSASRGARISGPGLRYVAAYQVARPPVTDRTGSPQHQRAFTSRLSADRSPSLPLDITTAWTGLLVLAGLSPAGIAASLAAPDPYGPNSGIRCMGLSLSRGVTRFWSSLLSILLFDPRREHSSVPTAYFHRRRAQRRSRTALLQRRRRLVLDGREHGGRLPAIGWLAAR